MAVSVSIIDCVYGRPASGLAVRLLRDADGVLTRQWSLRTDDDGRVSAPPVPPLPHGTYELEIDLESYFATLGFLPLNSAVTVRFHLPGENYHYVLTVLVTPSACIIYKES
jgi:5-hydroxyisourate hydrolase